MLESQQTSLLRAFHLPSDLFGAEGKNVLAFVQCVFPSTFIDVSCSYEDWMGGGERGSISAASESKQSLLAALLTVYPHMKSGCMHTHAYVHAHMHVYTRMMNFTPVFHHISESSAHPFSSILWLLWAVLVTVGEARAYQRRVPNLKWKNPINPKVYFSSLASSLNKMQWFQLLLHRIFYVLLSKYVPHLYDWVGQHLQACLLARVWYQPWEGSNWPGLNINKCSYSKVT